MDGLPKQRERLLRATKNLDYFEGRFPHTYLTEHSHRSSMIFNFITRKLTENLYKNSPKRTIRNNEQASNFLDSVYRDTSMFGKMPAADQLSLVTQAVALQWVGTDDPLHPIKCHLFDASQFHIWEDANDPLQVAAVVTFDVVENKRRATLYTTEKIGIYETDPMVDGVLKDTTFNVVSRSPNTYSCLPFEFCHYTLPTSTWWSWSPGDYLRKLNENVNRRLCQIDEAEKVYLKPPIIAEGVDPAFEPDKPYQAGQILHLPPADGTAHGSGNKPSLDLLKFDQTAVPTAWEDLQNYIDHTLECVGVPGASFRFVASAGRSGESLKAEQLPLTTYTRTRIPLYAHYEEKIAYKLFEVTKGHYESNGIPVPDWLNEALEDFQFNISWGDMWSEIPGEQRDRADLWLLQNNLTSKIQILMRRNGYTEVEAIQELKAIADDKIVEEAILGPQEPLVTQAVAPNTPQQANEADSQMKDDSNI